MLFSFGEYKTNVIISREIPDFKDITPTGDILLVADENTSWIAQKISGNNQIPCCVLKSGEENKNWQAVEAILAAAQKEGIGRDGTLIGIGGGVIGDLTAFAASVYMRGCKLILVSTTLLAMADASVGGKTGFDLFNVKNLAGTFYPAQSVYMPLDCLSTLPQKEWKSGFAEIIKTAILSGDDFLNELEKINPELIFIDNLEKYDILLKCIEKSVSFKGNIVSEDPRETGNRVLLNLGHTFGHALEAASGLGNITHGEAVAWGIIQACGFGAEIGITPRNRAEKIKMLISSFGYDCPCPHPFASSENFLTALKSDKKKKESKLTFIIPDEKSACIISPDENQQKILDNILINGFNL